MPVNRGLYSDINVLYQLSGNPELIFDVDAIRLSLGNLLNTPVGSRFFQPEYGSDHHQLLFELVDEETAYDILLRMDRAVERWEPRVAVDLQKSTVIANPDQNSYEVSIFFLIKETGQTGIFQDIVESKG